MKILISATYKENGEIVEKVYADIPVEEVAKKWGLIPLDIIKTKNKQEVSNGKTNFYDF
ncbi:hypothetical protein [Aminipila sp.]|uniref:hypothetical protein n=1 Tax=Aminipila sp. TaxID=2060095 RepID=UPI00289CFBF0|nr:hypothetical protein [Aminipila sp.]